MFDLKSILPRVRRFLVHRGRTAEDAEDLVQDAWIRMATHATAESVVNAEAFLMRTARNLSIDAYRAQRGRGEEIAIEDALLVDVAPGVEDQLLAKERLKRMAVCLARLPERTREMFLAYRVDGRTYRDIGEELGISAKTVERHVDRAAIRVSVWMEEW